MHSHGYKLRWKLSTTVHPFCWFILLLIQTQPTPDRGKMIMSVLINPIFTWWTFTRIWASAPTTLHSRMSSSRAPTMMDCRRAMAPYSGLHERHRHTISAPIPKQGHPLLNQLINVLRIKYQKRKLWQREVNDCTHVSRTLYYHLFASDFCLMYVISVMLVYYKNDSLWV